jgi:hypothetical protein
MKILKNIFRAAVCLCIIASARGAFAWNTDGIIPGTDIAYSGLAVTKQGVSVKLENASGDDVKVSLKLTFFDKYGNAAGYSLFGLREIEAGGSAEISNNYLTGKWKPCRDAARLEFEKMTYEPIYD